MDAEDDHAGLDAVEYVGEFQVLIPCVNVSQAVADLDLRRENKTLEEEVEADPELRPVIMFFYFDQFLGSFGSGIAGHVDVGLYAGQGIDPKISDAVALELDL